MHVRTISLAGPAFRCSAVTRRRPLDAEQIVNSVRAPLKWAPVSSDPMRVFLVSPRVSLVFYNKVSGTYLKYIPFDDK